MGLMVGDGGDLVAGSVLATQQSVMEAFTKIIWSVIIEQ